MREEYDGLDEMAGVTGVGAGIEIKEIDLGLFVSREEGWDQ